QPFRYWRLENSTEFLRRRNPAPAQLLAASHCPVVQGFGRLPEAQERRPDLAHLVVWREIPVWPLALRRRCLRVWSRQWRPSRPFSPGRARYFENPGEPPRARTAAQQKRTAGGRSLNGGTSDSTETMLSLGVLLLFGEQVFTAEALTDRHI